MGTPLFDPEMERLKSANNALQLAYDKYLGLAYGIKRLKSVRLSTAAVDAMEAVEVALLAVQAIMDERLD